jgi:hypothetical protein
MKIIFFFFILFTTWQSTQAQDSVSVTIHWKFTEIPSGFDHLNRTVIYVNGDSVKVSAPKLMSSDNYVTVRIPKGKTDIYVLNYVKFKGIWEEQLKVNDYSIDASLDLSFKFQNDTDIYMNFNVKKGERQLKIHKKRKRSSR